MKNMQEGAARYVIGVITIIVKQAAYFALKNYASASTRILKISLLKDLENDKDSTRKGYLY